MSEGSRRTHANVWTRARHPSLARYCHLLAHAQSRLADEARRSLGDAAAADAIITGKAAPLVLTARSLLRLGRTKEAMLAFDGAIERDPNAISQPLALIDLARTELANGRTVPALATYRRLVPLVLLVPSREEAVRVLIEAAHTSMTVAARAMAAPTGAGPSLEEALAFLREGKRTTGSPLGLDVALSLALVLDRAGRAEQASEVLAETVAAQKWSRTPSAYQLADPADRLVLEAMSLEASQATEAMARYRAYLATSAAPAPWRARAAARLALLERAPPRAKP
ncbi:MAG: hypothetical protein EXR75_08115 [Myxococcales bacterium]|nr:hypothetical protein [Myxococcales bacterium]